MKISPDYTYQIIHTNLFAIFVIKMLQQRKTKLTETFTILKKPLIMVGYITLRDIIN